MLCSHICLTWLKLKSLDKIDRSILVFTYILWLKIVFERWHNLKKKKMINGMKNEMVNVINIYILKKVCLGWVICHIIAIL